MKKYSLDIKNNSIDHIYDNYYCHKNKFDNYKILLIGETYSGKTSFINRIIDNTFIHNIKQTIGIDFKVLNVNIEHYIENNKSLINKSKKLFKKYIKNKNDMRLHFIDTSDYLKYNNIVKSYLKNVNLFIIIIDITQDINFDNIDKYISDIYNVNEFPNIYFIGNKYDSDNIKFTSINQLSQFCQINNYHYIDISCLTGYNINILLNQIIFIVLNDKYELDSYNSNINDQCVCNVCNIF
jgi:small GTP-binding protein